MLGASDRELVRGVKVDSLWNGVKRRAVLSQHVLPVFTPGELHVHETLTAPVKEGRRHKCVEDGDKREQKRDGDRSTAFHTGCHKTAWIYVHFFVFHSNLNLTKGYTPNGWFTLRK